MTKKRTPIQAPKSPKKELRHQMKSLHEEVIKMHQAIPSEHVLTTLIKKIYDDEYKQLDKLRRDAVNILNLLVEKGVVSREELNRVVDNG